MSWFNYISRDISLWTIYYALQARSTDNEVFLSPCKELLFYSSCGFVKGYLTKKSYECEMQQIRDTIKKGGLKETLSQFKELIEKRDLFIKKFIKLDLTKENSFSIAQKMKEFDKIYSSYWNHQIFAFDLDKAIEGRGHKDLLRKNQKLIKDVRGVNPYLVVDEKLLPHLFKFMSKKKLFQELLHFMLPTEIITLLEGKAKINKQELEKRKKHYLLMKVEGKQQFYSGENALKKYTELIPEEKLNLKEIKGVPAFQGKVTGKVKKVIFKEDLKKIKKDDVLVTHQTTPEYSAILGKVKAIITDEGGMLCHAAIISREMKIPCITGTRIATKALNTGDLVEVDANKGIVKILSKKL